MLGNPTFLVGVKCGVLTSVAFYYLTSSLKAEAPTAQNKENDVNIIYFNHD